MKTFLMLFSVLAVSINLANAANACKKDTCYSAVAVQGRSNPNLAQRRADCTSILRTVVDTDITTTVTTYTTAPTVSTTKTIVNTTIKTSTITSFSNNKRAIPTSDAELDGRDKIVISGEKPAYATACGSNSDYAVACLCAGNKAPAQSTATQIVTVTITTQTTSTSITTSTTTTTTSTTAAFQTGQCGATTKNFILQASNTGDSAVDGKFGQLEDVLFSGYRVVFNSDATDAQQFSIQPDCSLTTADGNLLAMVGGQLNLHPLWFFPSVQAASALVNVNWEAIICSANADQTLTCTGMQQSIFQVPSGNSCKMLQLGDQNYGEQVTVNLIPVPGRR